MSIAYIKTPSGAISLVVRGRPGSIAPDHPNYDRIVQALAAGDAAALDRLIDIPRAIAKAAGGRVTVVGDRVHLDGQPCHHVVADRIMACVQARLPFDALARFLERLQANPSRHAVEELYGFLAHHGLPITEDGCFLGYKRVTQDYRDCHSGKFDNTPGKVLSIPRNTVDDDWRIDCSNGFHVGAMSYVTNFETSGRIVIVKVDPADVVTVPPNETNKLRTCKYEVVCDYVGDLVASPVYDAAAQPVTAPVGQVPVDDDRDDAEDASAADAEEDDEEEEDEGDDAGDDEEALQDALDEDCPVQVRLDLERCNVCRNDLTAPDSVLLEAVVARNPIVVKTRRVDSAGGLLDDPDRLIAGTFVRTIRCAGCRSTLDGYLSVYRHGEYDGRIL